MSDPLVQLDFWPANDLNGSTIFSMTDQDTFFESLELRIKLYGLGGGALVTNRQWGAAVFDRGILQPEVFVRALIPSISPTKYLWAMCLDLRKEMIISHDELGGERYVVGGPGPLFYLTRGALFPEQFTSGGWNVDVANWIFRWGENARAGAILSRIINEVHNNTTADAFPDLTQSFDNTNDSAGNVWLDDIAGTDDFELPIGVPILEDVYDIQAAAESLDLTMNLGEVGAPLLELEAWQSLGRNLVPASIDDFSADVVNFREGVNIETNLEVSGTALRRYSHVIVRGLDNEWVVVARPGWSAGDYVKVGFLDYGRTGSHVVLENRGKRWLKKLDNGEDERVFEIKPGFNPTAGEYMPGPDGTNGHWWLGDSTGLTSGGPPGSWSALDYRNDPQRVTGALLRVDKDLAVKTDTAEQAARSFHVTPEFNIERQSDNRANQGNRVSPRDSNGGVGSHRHPDRPSQWIPMTPFDEHDLPHGFNLQKQGVILTRGGAGSWKEARVESPMVFYYPPKGMHGMVFVGYSGAAGSETTASIGLAWFENGLDEPPVEDAGNPLLTASGAGDDSHGCSGPFIWYENGRTHLFYIGLTASGYEMGTKTICHAYTDDLDLATATWTRDGAIVEPTGGTSWRALAIWHPNLVKRASRYFLFFNATGDDGVERIGYAHNGSLDAANWVVDDLNSPLVDVGAGGTWNDVRIGDPFVYRIGETWWMAFYGNDGSHSRDGFAFTSDRNFPLGWIEYPDNPVLDAGAGGSFDDKDAGRPAIWLTPTRYYHFYSTDDGTTGGVAIAVAWEDAPGLGSTGVDALDDLTDVVISSPADAARLRYNATTGQWEDSDLIWRPVMAQDPVDSTWQVLVDGDGTAVMAEG